MTRYSILMLTHNRLEQVVKCLISLEPTLERDDVELIIIDNASTDGTWEFVKEHMEAHPDKVVAIGLEQNAGVSGGREKLLYWMDRRTDIGIFLDSDVMIMDTHWLEAIRETLAREDIGICGPGGSFVLADWSGFTAGLPGRECDCVAGFCLAFKKELIDAGVKMDTDYGLFWTEDSDFCLQARALGYGVMCVPVGVWHMPAHSGAGKDETLHQRNIERFASKWRGKGLVKAEGGYVP